MEGSESNHTAFFSSMIPGKHPLLSAESSMRSGYFDALCYFTLHQRNDVFVNVRLNDFRWMLHVEQQDTAAPTVDFTQWKDEYIYRLLCDIALILLDDQLIINAEKEIEPFIPRNLRYRLEYLLKLMLGVSAYREEADLIEQYGRNRHHAGLPEKRIVVTANISAGKSTLINALIGKKLARTSEEACTGNITFFYNKPFEDGSIHFNGKDLTLHAGKSTLTSFAWDKETHIASFFRLLDCWESRLCIVDTPGVNSAINKQHGSITKEVLQKDGFDKVIYVLNASKLGTDEEAAYIRWISEHVPHDKVIFVLNKLDKYRVGEDDIPGSINGVRNDLLKYFKDPVICPLSARFALLLKMKAYGDRLTPREKREYDDLAETFGFPAYDLSKYYTCTYPNTTNESVLLSQKCGIYGLEKMLLGGNA